MQTKGVKSTYPKRIAFGLPQNYFFHQRKPSRESLQQRSLTEERAVVYPRTASTLRARSPPL